MEFYFNVILKCFIVYFVLIGALRLMGKREVGELSVFDVVIYLVMSELLAISISEPEVSVMRSLVPLAVLSLLQIMISLILLKCKKIRDLVDGRSVILIEHGVIMQERMRANRYSLDDLLSQLRMQGYFHVKDIAFAVLENNGTLSVISKKDCELITPDPLIQDGEICVDVLCEIHRDEKWLHRQLKEAGVRTHEDVFLCLAEKQCLYIITKHYDDGKHAQSAKHGRML